MYNKSNRRIGGKSKMKHTLNKISKTRFIRGINCPRFFPLFEIYKRGSKDATVSFTDDLSDLMTEENEAKKQALFEQMIEYETDEETDETEEVDLINVENKKLEVMLPYFNKMEEISAKYVQHKFNAPVVASTETRDQKRFEATIGDYSFYSFLDIYQETDEIIRVIEAKATTSSKFMDLTFTEDKEKFNFFELTPEGILMSREALGLPVGEKYFKKKQAILKRTNPIGGYLYDITYQRYVIEHFFKSNNIETKPMKYYLAILNHKYIFDGVYKDGQPDYYKDMDKENFLIRLVDVTDLTGNFLESFEADVEEVIHRLDHMTLVPFPLCPRKGKNKCMFHDICYKDIPKKDSIFTYIGNHNGFTDEKGEKYKPEDLIKMNMKMALDVPYSWLTRENNQIQYEVLSSGKPYMDKPRIKAILEKLEYPLYHLDFETFGSPLPRFKGEKAYDQSVFQFNLHIEHAPGVSDKDLDSYVYLATDHSDQRYQLTKYLCDLIGPKGTVVAWNDSFEKTRMKELAKLFPEFSDKLNDIISRTFDLWYVFKGSHHKLYDKWGIPEKKGFNYYHEALQGSFSIKKVLPIFVPDLSYSNLDVKNGDEAVVVYGNFPKMNKQEFEFNKRGLIEYCKQDTWAMVELLKSLREII